MWNRKRIERLEEEFALREAKQKSEIAILNTRITELIPAKFKINDKVKWDEVILSTGRGIEVIKEDNLGTIHSSYCGVKGRIYKVLTKDDVVEVPEHRLLVND